MRIDFIGAFVGLAIGFMIGAGAFGLVGGAIGGGLGLIIGGGIAYGFASAHADAIAATPHLVHCPGTGSSAEVRVEPDDVMWALHADLPPRLSGCSEWPARGGCDQACVKGSALYHAGEPAEATG